MIMVNYCKVRDGLQHKKENYCRFMIGVAEYSNATPACQFVVLQEEMVKANKDQAN